MIEIRARETLSGADTDALARCAKDEAVWRALPKLGEARRSSVARATGRANSCCRCLKSCSHAWVWE